MCWCAARPRLARREPAILAPSERQRDVIGYDRHGVAHYLTRPITHLVTAVTGLLTEMSGLRPSPELPPSRGRGPFREHTAWRCVRQSESPEGCTSETATYRPRPHMPAAAEPAIQCR